MSTFKTLVVARYQIVAVERYIGWHGTPCKFDEFDLNHAGKTSDPGDYGKGIYFDTDKAHANAYALCSGGGKDDKQLLKCFLALNSPYHIDFDSYHKEKWSAREHSTHNQNSEIKKYKAMLKSGGLDVDDKIDNFLSISRRYGSDKITKAIEQAGHDAVVVDYGSSKEIVVFDPKKIKIIDRTAPVAAADE